jgi:plasmid stabilization system protein ParE
LKRFEVSLTEDAVRDLEEIVDDIGEHDGPARASHVLDRIEEVVKASRRSPRAVRIRRRCLRSASATTGRPSSSRIA